MQENKKLRRMRSIDQIYLEIKKADPNSAITKYFIRNLTKDNSIYTIFSGAKALLDMDDVFDKLGLVRPEN